MFGCCCFRLVVDLVCDLNNWEISRYFFMSFAFAFGIVSSKLGCSDTLKAPTFINTPRTVELPNVHAGLKPFQSHLLLCSG